MIVDEIVKPLLTVPGASVQVMVEMEVDLSEAAPADIVQDVLGNGRTLKSLRQKAEALERSASG